MSLPKQIHPAPHQLPVASWIAGFAICGFSHLMALGLSPWIQVLSMGIPGATALLFLHWWGIRVIAGYLLSSLALAFFMPGESLSWSPAVILMNTITLAVSARLFPLNKEEACWLPNLRHTVGYLTRALLIPYAAGRLLAIPLMASLTRTLFAFHLQTDFAAHGFAFFVITLPALLFATPLLEAKGWSATRGSVTPHEPFLIKHGASAKTCALLAIAMVAAPLLLPFPSLWFILVILELCIALMVSAQAMAMANGIIAILLVLKAVPYLKMTAQISQIWIDAWCAFLFSGLVVFLFAMTLGSQRHLKRARQALSEELNTSLETLIQSFLATPEARVISRIKDGMIMEANDALTEVMGYTPAEVVGQQSSHLNMWASETDRNAWVAAIHSSKKVQSYEVELRHKSGDIYPYELNSHMFPLNSEPCIITTLRLNTEKKELEKELMQSRARYKEAQSIARLGHWQLDIPTGDLTWSQEIFNIFEIPPGTTPSYPLFLSMIHPDDLQLVRKNYNTSVEEKVPYETIHRIITNKQNTKYVHERGKTHYNADGDALFTMGTVQDITPIKDLEMQKEKTLVQLRQSQKLQSIGTLTSGIAHDFNNILSAILGYTDLSLNPPPQNPQLEENLKQILVAGERARDLIKKLLTFGKNQEPAKAPVKMNALLGEVIPLLRASLPSTVDIKESIESDATLMADATQLHQVVMNLCTNASHAMEGKGGILSLTLQEISVDESFSKRFVDMPTGDYLKLTISDTGHGMDATIRERIFDPFFTTKKDGEGTGLGLSVVHGIVASHDGQITVYSEPGLGTSISIFFPIPTQTMGPGAQHAVTIQDSPTGDEHLLVVDDEPALVDLFNLMLTALGYRVSGFTSSVKALEAYENSPDDYDAIITDLTMPTLTGTALIHKIREISPEKPVILCSGFPEGITQALSATEGPVTSLLKPIDRHTLAVTLRSMLDEPA